VKPVAIQYLNAGNTSSRSNCAFTSSSVYSNAHKEIPPVINLTNPVCLTDLHPKKLTEEYC